MKRVLVLCLAGLVSACNKAPETEGPMPRATPVQNAPATTPSPIQPLTSAPAMPHTTVVATPIATPAETTGTAAPSPSASPQASASPSPSATGS